MTRGVHSDSRINLGGVEVETVCVNHTDSWAFSSNLCKYPETNNWQDAALVALAVRLFDANARIRVITHTADKNLAMACARLPPEFGYYEIKSRYYNPPQTAKAAFPTVDQLTWNE